MVFWFYVVDEMMFEDERLVRHGRRLIVDVVDGSTLLHFITPSFPGTVVVPLDK
jgi:hypothetical protein